MKFQIPVDSALQPVIVGEYLRSQFFAEPHIWIPDVELLPDLPIAEHNHAPGEEDEGSLCDGCITKGFHWTRGQKWIGQEGYRNFVECRWYWDEDHQSGSLVFILPGLQYLVTSSSQVIYGWFLTTDREDF